MLSLDVVPHPATRAFVLTKTVTLKNVDNFDDLN
jgi:hypothetical protein